MVAQGFVPPMLAVAGGEDDALEGFAFEFKWDGVRAIVGVGDGRLTLWSRRGNDITTSYPELSGLGQAVPPRTVLDGEIVAFDDHSRPSFARLQRRMHVGDPGKAAQLARSTPVALLVFDLLEAPSGSRLDAPYEQRRAELEQLDLRGPHWQVPPHRTDGLEVIQTAARDLGLEGVVAKRLGSTYRPGVRSPDWRKLRDMTVDEFVVGGYRTGAGRREGAFGSLLLGYHDLTGALRFAGSVGSGFTDDELSRLERLLRQLRRDGSPFADPVPHREAVFVHPELVVDVQYSEFTPDGILRQPSYKGQRTDKSPAEVVREELAGDRSHDLE